MNVSLGLYNVMNISIMVIQIIFDLKVKYILTRRKKLMY